MTEAEGLILFFLAWLRQSFPTTREPQLPRKQESMEMKEFPSFEKSSLKKPLKWALAGRRTEGYAIFLRSHDAGALSRRLKFKAICPNNDEKKRKEGKRLWFFRRQTQPFFFYCSWYFRLAPPAPFWVSPESIHTVAKRSINQPMWPA